MAKRKIAILGGGLGSMTTAFWLTNQENWQDELEIDVYQMGWRLGGKGASGRGPNGRIEEHGLHIWIGFYDNAFRMIQATYGELGRASTAPLATWEEAFTAHSDIVITDDFGGKWSNWELEFPTNNRVPGDPGEFLTIWDYVNEGLQMLFRHLRDHLHQYAQLHVAKTHRHTFLGDLEARIGGVVEDLGVHVVEDLIRVAMTEARNMRAAHNSGGAGDAGPFRAILQHLHEWLRALEAPLLKSDELRRFYIVADLGLALARGIGADIVGNEADGFDEIDHLDFREWLASHGASQVAVNSAPIKALYDLVFAYENGEIEKPNFGAGAALLSTLRIGLDYKGAIFWKMNAGMGDTIFTPIYEVLKKRGVRFHFFHRVKNLGLSADGKQVASIEIGRQVDLKGKEYDPFMVVKDLNCWPSEPLYDQLVQGEQLKAQHANLESHWSPWQDVGTETLTLGKDFDEVVFGISLGSVPYVCPELVAASPKWDAMCKNVGTVRTMSMQWWLKPNLKELGWNWKSPVLDGYVDPMNTWADMSILIGRESWPAGRDPKNIAYYCGPMVGGIPDASDPTVPAKAQAEVVKVGLEYANTAVGYLWPKATAPGNPNGLDFSKLCGPFESQFFRANIDPSERYVLSLKGSVDHRIKPNESGFANLFLTGDWTYNYFNAGCVEATVIAGMLCSNAVTGIPKIEDIEGVRPGKWWE